MTSMKLYKKCSNCGHDVKFRRPRNDKYTIRLYDIYTVMQRCPMCKNMVEFDLSDYPIRGNNKIWGSDLRANRFVMVEENIMMPGFGENIINLFKNKIDFVTNGGTSFYKYGNGCWLKRQEYERTGVWKNTRNARREVYWMVHTVIDNNGDVESYIQW